MADSILERIAQWHRETLAEITEAAGYHQTLHPVEDMEPFLDGDTVQDLDTLCIMGSDEGAVVKKAETLGPNGTIDWLWRFDAITLLSGRAESGFTVDKRCRYVIQDIHTHIWTQCKTRMENHQKLCDGLAYAVYLLEPVKTHYDDLTTTINVPMAVAFEVYRHDPTSQPS